MDEFQKDFYRGRLKKTLSLYQYFSHEDVLTALLLKDKEKLKEIHAMHRKLKKCQEDFESTLDNGTEEEIDRALRTFARPDLND